MVLEASIHVGHPCGTVRTIHVPNFNSSNQICQVMKQPTVFYTKHNKELDVLYIRLSPSPLFHKYIGLLALRSSIKATITLQIKFFLVRNLFETCCLLVLCSFYLRVLHGKESINHFVQLLNILCSSLITGLWKVAGSLCLLLDIFVLFASSSSPLSIS